MKSRLLMIVCLLCLSFGQVFAYLENQENKEYVSAEQIVVNQEGIFVILNGEAVPVSGIAHDAEGIYCVKSTWKCPKCGFVNQWYYTKCQNCGY
jgi:hypothetical protein